MLMLAPIILSVARAEVRNINKSSVLSVGCVGQSRMRRTFQNAEKLVVGLLE